MYFCREYDDGRPKTGNDIVTNKEFDRLVL